MHSSVWKYIYDDVDFRGLCVKKDDKKLFLHFRDNDHTSRTLSVGAYILKFIFCIFKTIPKNSRVCKKKKKKKKNAYGGGYFVLLCSFTKVYA